MTGKITKPLSKTYGRWTVLEHIGQKARCRCECGTERLVVAYDLRKGVSTNCGCVRKETLPAAAKSANKVHGASKSTEYRVWVDMRRRCHSPERPDFHRYGGRGIEVCERWRDSFETFLADMGPRPKGRTLDRRDNDGPYSPTNCYWATKWEQERNKRTNVRVVVDGVAMIATDAAQKLGVSKNVVSRRMKSGKL